MSREENSAKVESRRRSEVGTCVLWQMPVELPQENRGLLREGKIPRLYPAHHSAPSAQTCALRPNKPVAPSIIHFCAFQRVIFNLKEAITMATIPNSWKRPRVVKVKRKRLLQGQNKVFFPSNPRFNVRVHLGVKEPKLASEHSLVKISRRGPPTASLSLTPPLYRSKPALTTENKVSGRQTSRVKPWKKKQGPMTENHRRGSSQDCGCYFIKFILSPGSLLHSKIHYYIRQSMGNYSLPLKRVSLISVAADGGDIHH